MSRASSGTTELPMTNYVVCLAHFCEIHGPLTILCTQIQDSVPSTGVLAYSLCESCSLSLPGGASTLTTLYKPEDKPPVGPGFHDKPVAPAPARQFVSTRYPPTQKLYTSLMKLVMKCLSVEAVADSLKPLFVGDAINGYSLSKVFSLPDYHARGGERKYAFLVACDVEKKLLLVWDIVACYVAEMTSFLQATVEQAHEKAKGDGNERFLRRQKNMAKNLVELTSDPDVFCKLHLCAAELLNDIV